MLALGTDLRGLDSIRKNTPLAQLSATLTQAQAALKDAQIQQAKGYNAQRRTLHLQVGDQVLLLREGLQAQEEKLLAKKINGAFSWAISTIGIPGNDNYKLELPARLHFHPVFHISLLRPYSDPGEKRHVNRPKADANKEYEVEAIIGQRTRHKKTQYLVQWLGYDKAKATWAEEGNFQNARQAVADFHKALTLANRA
ncbi:MAG: hypothetical protein BJ554DRAFT_4936 [Olpidium bornovanus]|uniref:Chromo domain-containing protein n=1 Tax=Olpidium bornovanus TaxID=278681 RepID=A0A8H7ZMD8_9FUNG|nr:MAG: hypothetical protein BJ554DRAFT_4936 [Olpidium bornovanus]